jgi:predicted SnoaL-like aldol condensation-catalyzing enzyme
MENKQITEKFIDETFNKMNLENISSFLTPDFIYHGSGEDISGVENFKEWVSLDHNIIPDIHLSFVRIYTIEFIQRTSATSPSIYKLYDII